ncbi:DUF4397 domain-containing protein [Saccharomonospora saliphila]|uniref:DUF4397 domain-containing protein n=1 Tax=Saccharomonospora saliphila TaxID=369829 RepID=UPI00037BD7B1|nr:DUF4397 domain-containing protein [Saccharomonospora saliphila]
MRKLLLGALSGVTAAALAVAAGGVAAADSGQGHAASAQATGTVYVVHGIPGTPVDVYVDGERALDDFQPETTQGPLTLPSGSHQVQIFPADAPDATGQPVVEATADVPADGNVSLVAHLDEGGTPTLTPYANDVSPVPTGQARLVVRHDAAAPAVDVRADGVPVVSGLTNPNQEALVVDAGTVQADVVLAGTEEVVIGPASLPLEEGTATFVHAVGSAEEGTLTFVPLTISDLSGAPSGVPAGVAEPADSGLGWVVGGSLATLLALTAVAAVRRTVTSREP